MKIETLIAAGLAAALLSFSSAGAAAPQRSRFSAGEARVFPAASLVNEANGTQFRIGQDLMLTIQSTRAAGGLAPRVAGVRLFTLGPGERRPHPWASFDPCNVYFSTLFGARAVGRRVNLGNLGSMGFLTVTTAGVSKGRFLLVFESGTEGGGRMFRINKADEQAYFAKGLYVEVLPTRSYGAREIADQQARVRAGSASLEAEARRNDPSLRCYRIRTVTADGSPSAELAYVGDCKDVVEAAASTGAVSSAGRL